MAKVRKHLARAPISEALIDFRVKPGSAVDLKALQRIPELLKSTYEQKSPIFEWQTSLSVSPTDGPHAKSAARELGVRLQSIGGRYVLQVRSNGFTLSRLEPYENWDTLLAETRLLWTVYVSSVQIESVARVATRFINNLQLPMQPGEEFGRYLTKPPEVPYELPQGVLSFMQHIVLREPEQELYANVIQLLQEGHVAVDHIPVMLDIDAYKPVVLPPDSDDLWTLLAQLREFKNAIFFASLTETAVGLFE